MKKRFTDADKWDDPWFLGLAMPYKVLWIHLLDKCNQAGIYKVNMEMIAFCLNVKFDRNEVLRIFEGRVFEVGGEKWFIPKFIDFQYGTLSEDCKPHKSVIDILKKENLLNFKGYTKGIHTLKDKDKDKIKIKTIKREDVSDEGFVETLKKTYDWVDIDSELKKMDMWISNNKGRKKSQRFIINWLNKIEKVVSVNTKSRADLDYERTQAYLNSIEQSG